jgi:hypothetical protein
MRMQVIQDRSERDLQLLVFIERNVLDRSSEVEVTQVLPIALDDEIVVVGFRALLVADVMNVALACLRLFA